MEKYILKFEGYPDGTEKIFTEEKLEAYFYENLGTVDKKEWLEWKENGLSKGFLKRIKEDIVVKEYVIRIETSEEKPINKYYHFIHRNYDSLEMETMDFVDFNYPMIRVIDTEEKINAFVDGLIKEGFKVTIEE